MHEMFLK